MENNINIQIPEDVAYILEHLKENGFEAYAVGGCVRDVWLGRKPEDWDITTSAKPEQVKLLFRRTLDTGIQHGTVTVMMDKIGYEITTYRIDGEYEDNRHPKEVEYTTSLVEDLRRRDFTINAMAYNPTEGMVDEFDGIDDIERKRIRCVGNPEHRFEEDALRMLRAVRFSGQLGFDIEMATREAIQKKAQNIEMVSAERIRVELNKLLLSKGEERIRDAYLLGLTKVFLPEFDRMMETEQNNPHHIYGVGEHSIQAVVAVNKLYEESNLENEKLHSILCWTMLLHDVAKPACQKRDEQGVDHFYGHDVVGEKMAKDILNRLRFDNYTLDIVVRLVRWHSYRFEESKKAIRKAVSKIGVDIIRLLFIVQRADAMAKNQKTCEEKLADIERTECLYHEIEAAGDPIAIKDLMINGRDLMEVGYPSGILIGEILNHLLECVLEEPERNEMDKLIAIAKEYRPV